MAYYVRFHFENEDLEEIHREYYLGRKAFIGGVGAFLHDANWLIRSLESYRADKRCEKSVLRELLLLDTAYCLDRGIGLNICSERERALYEDISVLSEESSGLYIPWEIYRLGKIGQLMLYGQSEFLKIHGMGQNRFKKLSRAIEKLGLWAIENEPEPTFRFLWRENESGEMAPIDNDPRFLIAKPERGEVVITEEDIQQYIKLMISDKMVDLLPSTLQNCESLKDDIVNLISQYYIRELSGKRICIKP